MSNSSHDFLQIMGTIDISLFISQDGTNLPILPSQRAPNLYMVPQGIRPVVQLTAIEVRGSLSLVDPSKWSGNPSCQRWNPAVSVLLSLHPRECVQTLEIVLGIEGCGGNEESSTSAFLRLKSSHARSQHISEFGGSIGELEREGGQEEREEE